MATAAQLKALIKSFTDGDDKHFVTVANQIAAHAEGTGKKRLAEDLRLLVKAAKLKQGRTRSIDPVSIAKPTGDLAGLLSVSHPSTRLSHMALEPLLEKRLRKVVTEFKRSETLASFGLQPRRKLLLFGEPGCGKTMTASSLAGELGLPLLQVEFHTLIAKYMGETSSKLHKVFESMESVLGVYLFDEFDAIAAHRGMQNDVGEIRRVLNSFLVFLEKEHSRSIIIAATNLPELIDTALHRRFDDILHYGKPNAAACETLIRNRLSLFDITRIDWTATLEACSNLSHADVVRACEDAAKEAVLAEQTQIERADIAIQLRARSSL